MNRVDAEEAARILTALAEYEEGEGPLPGLHASVSREVLARQIVESQRRTRYLSLLSQREITAGVTDPQNEGFDPLKAAVVYRNRGAYDEACWLVFLSVHFGKNKVGGWGYCRGVYGHLGQGPVWSWPETCGDLPGFQTWLEFNREQLVGGFGNHRKYESLSGISRIGTGAVVASYVTLIRLFGDHEQFLSGARPAATPEASFEKLYRSLKRVIRFGRTASFDYLTTLAKLDLAGILPGRAYLTGATGPLQGARLLFTGSASSATRAGDLEQLLARLNLRLELRFDDLEDALCNWQKSPLRFVPFRG